MTSVPDPTTTQQGESTPASPANLFDEPFEKWWRQYEHSVNVAMQLGTRDVWREVLCMAFVCGAKFASGHLTAQLHGPADELCYRGDNSHETNVDRGRSR